MKLKTNKLILTALSLFLLSGCSSPSSEEDVTFISPTGAPALAFFDQGNNANYVTNSTPSLVLAELQANNYDVVISPVYGGLASIKKNNLDFALASVITGGNFFLAGINKEASEKPTDTSYIVAFAEKDVTGMVLNKLAREHWGISTNNIRYVSAASDTLPILKSGKHAGNDVDYVFTAEPVFTSARSALDEGVSLVETYNISKEWKDLTNQNSLVQAGVFIRKSAYQNKKNKLKVFMDDLKERQKIAINEPSKMKEALDSYGNDEAVVKRFGFKSTLAYNLMNNGNRFGIINPNDEPDVNTFLTSLGVEAYSQDYFINI